MTHWIREPNGVGTDIKAFEKIEEYKQARKNPKGPVKRLYTVPRSCILSGAYRKHRERDDIDRETAWLQGRATGTDRHQRYGCVHRTK